MTILFIQYTIAVAIMFNKLWSLKLKSKFTSRVYSKLSGSSGEFYLIPTTYGDKIQYDKST